MKSLLKTFESFNVRSFFSAFNLRVNIKSIILFGIVFFCFSQFNLAQNQADDFKTIIDSLQESFKNLKYDKAHAFGESALAIANEAKNDSMQAVANQNMAIVSRKTDPDRFLSLITLSEEKALKANLAELLAKIYSTRANFHYTRYEDAQAMKFLVKSDSVMESNAIVNKATISNLQMLQILVMQSQLEVDSIRNKKALTYIQKSIKVSKQLKDSISLAKSYNSYAMLFQASSKFDSAIYISRKALKLIEATDDIFTKNRVFWDLAGSYSNLKNYDSAIFYCKKRVALYENTEGKEALALAYSSLGSTYNKQNYIQNRFII